MSRNFIHVIIINSESFLIKPDINMSVICRMRSPEGEFIDGTPICYLDLILKRLVIQG